MPPQLAPSRTAGAPPAQPSARAGRRRAWGDRTTIAGYRTALLVLCMGLSLRPPYQLATFAVLLPLALLTWWGYRRRSIDVLVPYAGGLLVVATIPLTGGGRSALLPYLLAPGITLGLTRGLRELATFTGSLLVGLALACAVQAPADPVRWLSDTGQWVLIAAALGGVAVYARSIDPAPPEALTELRDALRNLRELTHRLPGGLDAASAAEGLLERALELAGAQRGAVLVATGGDRFAPLAARGAARVPWREPAAGDGPLREAWESGRPVVDRRDADTMGRRRGGVLAAVPIAEGDARLGLLVVEARDPDRVGAAELAALVELARLSLPRLEVALLFEEIRVEASADERDRLAREMHDGIAQELAFVGYRLDAAQLKAAAASPELAAELREVRQVVTALISDLRLSITDLRTTTRSDRGLGAVLSGYVRSAFTGRGVAVTVELHESAFRLDGELESCLFAVVQAFVQLARRLPVVAVSVALESDPPSARLVLSASGAALEPALPDDLVRRLAERGARLVRADVDDDATTWEVRVKEALDDDPGPARR